MTNAELKFLRKLYKSNHRISAIYVLGRNLVKWPLEILVVFPLVIIFGIVVVLCKGIAQLMMEIGYTIYEESQQFWRDWRSVYRLWTEKPKNESEATDGK